MWRDIKKIIHHHQNFILTTHVNPDGDGIGACCALTELLVQMGKNVRFVCQSPIPKQFAFLDYHHTQETYHLNNDYSTAQVLIILDTHKRERIGELAKLIDQPNMISICIDHHEASETFTPYTAIDSKSCSVGAMIYTLYKESGFELNMHAAEGIYISIICDTGRFSNSSTSRKAHKIADECIKLGVNPDEMYQKIFQHVTLSQFKMFANSLRRMETFLNNRVIIQQICLEDYAMTGENAADLEHVDLEFFLEFNKLIEDVECVVLLREISPDLVRVSLRSKSTLDISKVVIGLGGGGHSKAAGVSWKGSLIEVKQKIIDLLKDVFDQQSEMTSVAINN